MRVSSLLLLLLLSIGTYSCSRAPRLSSLTTAVSAQERRPVAASSPKVDFATQIEPFLQTKCHPCHFSGGKVYDKLPFDRPSTIKTLGTKLFTRIQDENERKLIREFLAQD